MNIHLWAGKIGCIRKIKIQIHPNAQDGQGTTANGQNHVGINLGQGWDPQEAGNVLARLRDWKYFLNF